MEEVKTQETTDNPAVISGENAVELREGIWLEDYHPFHDVMEIVGSDEQKAEMFSDLAKYYAEVGNPENTTMNAYFKAKYAPLGEVLNTVRPVLGKYGLAITQAIGTGVNESPYEGKCVVSSVLTHKSGAYIVFPAVAAAPTKGDVQGIGATLTYLRRFAVNAVAGVAGEVDDDGQKSSETAAAKKEKTPREKIADLARAKAKANRKAVDAVIAESSETKNIKDIPDDKLDSVMKKLEEIEA